MNFFIISTIICSLLVVLFILNRKQVDEKRILLSIFYALIINVSLHYYATVEQIGWLYLLTNVLSTGAGYIIGAICYLFITAHFEKLGFKRIFTSLLPFLTFLFAVSIPFTLSNPSDGYFFDYLVYVNDYGEELYILELLFFFAFTLKAHIRYRTYRTALIEKGTANTRHQMSWIKQLIVGIYVFISLDFLINLYTIIREDADFPELYVSALLIGFITFYISYHGIYKSKIFAPATFASESVEPKKTSHKYNGLSLKLSASEAKALEDRLLYLLEEKKMYLNPSLSLTDLAKEMELTEKKLSHFLNARLDTGYYELINQYRLNEFLQRLENPKNKVFSLMAIANESGFKSKTSFYAYFKKQKGMTPSAYHKEMLRN